PKETREKIRQFYHGLTSMVFATRMMAKAARVQSEAGFGDTSKKFQKLIEEIPKLKEELEDEFQKQLGIIKDRTDATGTALIRQGISPAVVASETKNLICNREQKIPEPF